MSVETAGGAGPAGYIYAEFYKRDASGVETFLFTTGQSIVFSDATATVQPFSYTVPTPISATSFTCTRASGFEFFRSWMSCFRSSIE